MNHKNGFNPLSRTTAHRRAMSRNMVTSLFRYERITTTKAKALEVRKTAEKLITRAKVDSVHNRREVAKYIQDEKVLDKLFTNIAKRMEERNGGYTRVLKIGYRQGDAADVVILELVDYKLDKDDEPKKDVKAKKETKAKTEAKTEKKSTKKADDSESADTKKKTTTKAKKSETKKEEAKAE